MFWSFRNCHFPLLIFLNRTFASGMTESDIAPADSPKIVTISGSPPKNEIRSWIHSSACIWSTMPFIPPFSFILSVISKKTKDTQTIIYSNHNPDIRPFLVVVVVFALLFRRDAMFLRHNFLFWHSIRRNSQVGRCCAWWTAYGELFDLLNEKN